MAIRSMPCCPLPCLSAIATSPAEFWSESTLRLRHWEDGLPRSGRREPDRHRLVAADHEAAGVLDGLAGDAEVRQPAQQRLEEDLELEARERRSDAVVDPQA